jgi:two-component system chemotaxis response regulator CheB
MEIPLRDSPAPRSQVELRAVPSRPAESNGASIRTSSPSGGAFDVVVMAASMGGPEAVREVISRLPAWFPAAVLVVQHRTPAAQYVTGELLRRVARLEVTLAQPGDEPIAGRVQVLPADRQLVLGADGRMQAAARVGSHRPTADPLFRSVAEHFGARALGVILSGTGEDGAAGVAAIKRAGGRVLTQDRFSARCFGMPAAAIATGCVDLVLPIGRIADALVSLVLWPGAADLLRVPLPPWAMLDHEPRGQLARSR